MGISVFILGRSGTGKSRSIKSVPPEKVGIVNIESKLLPFPEALQYDTVDTDDPDEVLDAIEDLAKKYKIVVVDDYQYLMSNEFMRRSDEKTWDKFTDIARHAWDVVQKVKSLPKDVIVYIMCHNDSDADGNERLKTIGKLLDEKIVLEGMSTIVLKTGVIDGKYFFYTQNNGKDTCKSPEGMFTSRTIENDLKYVDDKIRAYYKIGNYTPEDQIEDKSIEEPKRQRRRLADDPERKAIVKENAMAVANAGLEAAKENEESVNFDEVEMPETKELPKRKRRAK